MDVAERVNKSTPDKKYSLFLLLGQNSVMSYALWEIQGVGMVTIKMPDLFPFQSSGKCGHNNVTQYALKNSERTN